MKFTIFTPTYNRAHTLPRLFESLLQQTCRDFEWLIIDDSSTDHTGDLVGGFIKRAPFPVRYCPSLINGGKHIAHNSAVKLADGELFAVLDSDDSLVPNALQHLDLYWNQVGFDYREKCCGVACLCCDSAGNIIGDLYPRAALYSTLAERTYRYKITGEHWGVMRTNLLRLFPFPCINGFVPEGLVWLRIAAAGYYDYCCNDALRIYWNTPNSLSKRRGLTKGEVIYAREMIGRDWRFARHAPMRFLKAGLAAMVPM